MVLRIVVIKGLDMSLPILFEGYMMLQDVGADAPVPYNSPVKSAADFKQAYSSFIRPTEDEARGLIARAHVDYLNDLDVAALAKVENWEPAAFVRKVDVYYSGDIRLVEDGVVLSREDIYDYEGAYLPEAVFLSIPQKVDLTAIPEDVKFAVLYVNQRLRPDSQQLFKAITTCALGAGDPEYTGSFNRWLGGDSGTAILRDELAYPYESMFDDRKVEGRQNNAWFDAWCGIDSAKLAYREEFRVGSLRSSRVVNVDDEVAFSGPRM
jgi:hypothetical protein